MGVLVFVTAAHSVVPVLSLLPAGLGFRPKPLGMGQLNPNCFLTSRLFFPLSLSRRHGRPEKWK